MKEMSHPSRGEWIEITSGRKARRARRRLTPRGVSGLKLVGQGGLGVRVGSHPSRGEWIEIPKPPRCAPARGVSPLVG